VTVELLPDPADDVADPQPSATDHWMMLVSHNCRQDCMLHALIRNDLPPNSNSNPTQRQRGFDQKVAFKRPRRGYRPLCAGNNREPPWERSTQYF